MNICGVICEYNPFHRGHAYQIAEIRKRLGADTAVVCAMSGDFVQRGEAAAYIKHDRARAAIAGGADLILELPLPWAVSSAEGFARGGIGMLGATGIVTHLAFGSESGDISALQALAELLLRPEADCLILRELQTGKPYAAARQAAVERLAGRALPEMAAPNDILAVEYLKALRLQKLHIEPLAVRRKGAAHDSSEADEWPSASLLRQKLWRGESIDRFLPEDAAQTLMQGNGPVSSNRLETAMLSRLRNLTETDYARLPDVSEGLHHRIFRAARTEPSLEAILDAAASKRYPRARLRRICVCAALEIKAGDNEGIPPYLRVLAANGRGLELLREMENRCSLPMVIKPGKVRELDTECQRIFEIGAAAEDLYRLGFSAEALRRGDSDWRTSPFIVK